MSSAGITITNQETNIETKAALTSGGQYTVTNLQPGVYTITVSANGFVTKVIRDVRLNAASPYPKDEAISKPRCRRGGQTWRGKLSG